MGEPKSNQFNAVLKKENRSNDADNSTKGTARK